jgi:hypothetical protein
VARRLDERVFWESTIEEVEAVFKRSRDRDKREDLRAGLIASRLEKGKKPGDYFRERAAKVSEEFRKRFEERPVVRSRNRSD